MNEGEVSEALRRIEREFADMPGLKLTAVQVHRLCAIPEDACEAALSRLIRAGVLRQSSDGGFLRPN